MWRVFCRQFHPQCGGHTDSSGRRSGIGTKKLLDKVEAGTGAGQYLYAETPSQLSVLPQPQSVYKEITFDGLDEKDKRWLLKRCDLKEDSEISLRRIEEATAITMLQSEYSSATYNLPEAPPAEVITCIFLFKQENMRIS